MCQRLHGNFGSHSKARKVNITITKDDGLAWYKTSEVARRGFCRDCDSGLFWEPFKLDATGISAGSLDSPTNLRAMGHIFVGEKNRIVMKSRMASRSLKARQTVNWWAILIGLKSWPSPLVPLVI